MTKKEELQAELRKRLDKNDYDGANQIIDQLTKINPVKRLVKVQKNA